MSRRPLARWLLAGLLPAAAVIAPLGICPSSLALVDSQGTGTSDVWAFRYFGRVLSASEAAADYIGDGRSNRQKSLFGLDPFDATAFSRLAGTTAVTGGTVTFSFPSVAGIAYQVQSSPDLTTWTNLGGLLTGTGATLQATAPAPAEGRLFFRLQAAPAARPDADADGLDAYEETLAGSSDTATDTDSDTLTDLEEFGLQAYFGIPSDPTRAITVPGTADGAGDFDGDGVLDAVELRANASPANPASYPPNASGLDTDRDGLPDAWEVQQFGNITAFAGRDDPDNDTLTNRQENRLALNPLNPRTDGVYLDGQGDQDSDNVLDVWELEDGTDPFSAGSVDLATNYIVLETSMVHRNAWQANTQQAQYTGTVLRATAIGFETARLASAQRTFGIVNQVSNFLPDTAPGDFIARASLRYRKGVKYRVEISSTNNNLPFISGRFRWVSGGNADEPNNKFFTFEVDNRQTYVADNNGNPVAADPTISPNPDPSSTFFTYKVASGATGPDATTYPTGTLTLTPIGITRAWSDQFPDVEANWMPDGTGIANKPYVFMGAFADGTAYAKARIQVNVTSDKVRDKLLWRLAKRTSGGLVFASGTSSIDAATNLLSVTATSPEATDYVLAGGVDKNNDGQLSADEAVVTPTCLHDPPGGGYNPARLPFTFKVVNQARYAQSLDRLTGQSNGLVSRFALPQSARLLKVFATRNLPAGTSAVATTIGRTEPGLTHPVGIFFAPNTVAGPSEDIQFPPEDPLSLRFLESVALNNFLAGFLETKRAEVLAFFNDPANNGQDSADFQWNVGANPGFGFSVISDLDLAVALGRVTIPALTVDARVSRFGLIVDDVRLTGQATDLYDFDYDSNTWYFSLAGIQPSAAAEVQAGYNTLGLGGRVFRSTLVLDDSTPGDFTFAY